MSSAAVGKPAGEQPENIPRRRFVNVLLGTGLIASAASFLYPIMKYFVPPKIADVGANAVLAAKISELKPNTSKTFRFGTRPGLLIEIGAGEYRAMSATCTHLGCTVQYRPDLREIWCACHNGMYDLNGRNISGPPPRPLETYDVQVRGEDIFVRRKQEA